MRVPVYYSVYVDASVHIGVSVFNNNCQHLPVRTTEKWLLASSLVWQAQDTTKYDN